MSKYVRDTGPGYLGRHSISDGTAQITISGSDLPWEDGDYVHAIRPDTGIALVRTLPDHLESLGRYRVCEDWGLFVTISGRPLRELGLRDGEDVRVYERAGQGLLVVPAEADPTLDGKGTGSSHGLLTDGGGSAIRNIKRALLGDETEPLRRRDASVEVLVEDETGGVALRELDDGYELCEFDDQEQIYQTVWVGHDELGAVALELAELADRGVVDG